MKVSDAVRDIMKSQDMGVTQLAKEMGKTPRLVSERLSQDNISLKKLEEMLKVLGYDMVLVPTGESISESSYLINSEEL